MSDEDKIRETIERAVRNVFAAEIPKVRDAAIHRVLDELRPVLAPPPGGTPTDKLKTAVAGVQEAVAQSDILRALLDGAASFAARAALLLTRGATAVGWQGRGFRENDAIKLLAVDLNHGLSGHVFQQRVAVTGPAAHFEPRFIASFGAPIDGDCMVLPLAIRDKVVALLYADAGTQPGGKVDAAALELLVRSGGLWLEVLALRKAGSAPQTAAVSAAAPSPPPPAVAPAKSPESAGATAALHSADVVSSRSPAVLPPSPPAVKPDTAVAVAAASSANTAESPAEESEDDEERLHRKARRFAKLLVDEIKLYNHSKVTEGKRNRDLYTRLKADIDKSRATYDERYGHTAAASADYFTQELIRGLADSNPALLGSSFPR